MTIEELREDLLSRVAEIPEKKRQQTDLLGVLILEALLDIKREIRELRRNESS